MLSFFSRPPYPARPAYTPRILPSQLTPLFPVETLRSLVYPYIPFDIHGIEQYPDSDPVWFACLEPYYHLVCPLLFDLLEQEDKHSHAVIHLLVDEYDYLMSFRRDFGDYPAKLKRDEAAVVAEMLERWTSVYALHGMRKAFLDHHWHLEQQRQRELVEKEASHGTVTLDATVSSAPTVGDGVKRSKIERNRAWEEKVVEEKSIKLAIPVPAPPFGSGLIWPSSLAHPNRSCDCAPSSATLSSSSHRLCETLPPPTPKANNQRFFLPTIFLDQQPTPPPSPPKEAKPASTLVRRAGQAHEE